jgi:hypothetical protein
VLTMPTDTGSAALANREPAITAGAASVHDRNVLRVTRAGLLEMVAIGVSFTSSRHRAVDLTFLPL